MKDELLLALIKQATNKRVRILRRMLPPMEKPKMRITQLLYRCYMKMKKSMMEQNPEYYKDTNFPKFLDTAMHILMFIADTDGHYRVWLAYALGLFAQEFIKEFQAFDHKKFYEENKDKIKLQVPLESPEGKMLMFQLYMYQHPYNIQGKLETWK